MSRSMWPHHLLQHLRSQCQNGILCDVNIATEEETLPAHASVLSACSTQLESQFITVLAYDSTNTTFHIQQQNTSAAAVRALLDVIYGGEMPSDPVLLQEVLAIAEQWGVDRQVIVSGIKDESTEKAVQVNLTEMVAAVVDFKCDRCEKKYQLEMDLLQHKVLCNAVPPDSPEEAEISADVKLEDDFEEDAQADAELEHQADATNTEATIVDISFDAETLLIGSTLYEGEEVVRLVKGDTVTFEPMDLTGPFPEKDDGQTIKIPIIEAVESDNLSECGVPTNLEKEPESNTTTMTGRKAKFKCNECGKNCWSKTHLKRHRAQQHPLMKRGRSTATESGLKKPIDCEKTFTTSSALQTRKQAHRKGIDSKNHPKKTLPSYKSVEQQDVDRTMSAQNHSDDSSQPTLKASTDKVQFACKECEKACVSQRCLQNHFELYHSDKRKAGFQCKVCAEVFKHMSALQRHSRMSHRSVMESSSEFRCVHCDSIFPSLQTWQAHQLCVRAHQNTGNSPSTTKSGDVDVIPGNERVLPPHPQHAKKKNMTDADMGTMAVNQEKKSDKSEGERGFECKLCAQLCDDLSALEQHTTVSHPSLVQSDQPNSCFDLGASNRSLVSVPSHQNCSGRVDNVLASCDQEEHKVPFERLQPSTRGIKADAEETPKTDEERCTQLWECNLCKKTFDVRRGLLHHVKMCHTPEEYHELCKPQFQCSDCGKEFQIRQSLRFHRIREHGDEQKEKSFKCTHCSKAFTTKYNLQVHLMQEHDVDLGLHQPYVCQICGRRYKNKHALKSHRKQAHSISTVHRCRVCSEPFTNYLQWRRHEKTHNEQNFFQCQYCGAMFPHSSRLQKHENVVHHHLRGKCHICCERVSENQMNRHLVEKHSDTITVSLCSFCGEKFANAYRLGRHLSKCKANPNPKQTKMYQCSKCSKSFSLKQSLQNHEYLHSLGTEDQDNPFICIKCGQAFSTKSKLDQHIRRKHDKSGWVKCEHCEKSFSSESERRQHERFHTGEKPFQCKHCESRFYTVSALYAHERRHIPNRPRPHACDECGKTFCHRYELAKHQQSHTDIRSFECEYCDKKFRRSYHLKTHIHSKHEYPIPTMECFTVAEVPFS